MGGDGEARRPEAVIRAELAEVDAALIAAQKLYRSLELRRLRLVTELIAPAIAAHLADRAGADQVAEGSAEGGMSAPGTDTPRGSDQ